MQQMIDEPLLDKASERARLIDEIRANETRHSGRTLAEHLLGVAQILTHWSCSESLIDAGMFHSVYGTVYFRKRSLDNRDRIREVVGEEAENIIYKFCNLGHPRVDKAIATTDNPGLRQALLTIEAANKVELGKRVPGKILKYLPEQIKQDCTLHNEKIYANSD